MGRIHKLWCGHRPHPNHALLSCLNFCLWKTLWCNCVSRPTPTWKAFQKLEKRSFLFSWYMFSVRLVNGPIRAGLYTLSEYSLLVGSEWNVPAREVQWIYSNAPTPISMHLTCSIRPCQFHSCSMDLTNPIILLIANNYKGWLNIMSSH